MQTRWKTNEQGMANLITACRVAVTGKTLSYVRYLDDFRAFPLSNAWMDIGGIQSRTDPKVYVVQTADAGRRTLLADVYRPGRSCTRSHLRRRYDSLCRRTMGSSMDHYRHFPGRTRSWRDPG